MSGFRLMSESLHSIQQAAARAGLTPHVIRAWEKRYGAVSPARTGSQRRRYNEEDLERLGLLATLTRGGHAISSVAALPLVRLRELVRALGGSTPRREPAPGAVSAGGDRIGRALEAIRRLDSVALGEVMSEAEVDLGSQGVLQKLIAPLIQAIGEQWRDGVITAAHEHFASGVIRIFLGHAARPFSATLDAPVLTVATPSGQLHEMGALLAGAYAANLGWRIIYLGAGLGAADIAGAALQNQSRALALSLVYPEDDPNLGAELIRLREFLPGLPIIAGGRAVPSYHVVLERVGAKCVTDLSSLGVLLDQLRRVKSGGGGLTNERVS